MNLIYVHIGRKIPNYKSNQYGYTVDDCPSYLFDSIKQTRKITKCPIHVVVSQKDILENQSFFKDYSCICYDYETLLNDSKILDFIRKIAIFRGGLDSHFWLVTFLRLLVVDKVIRDNKLTDVFHIENDNLIYYDLEVFKNLSGTYIAPLGPYTSTAGIFYTKDTDNMSFFVDKLGVLLETTKKDISDAIRIPDDLITEMHLIDIIKNVYSYKVKYFPVLPFDQFSMELNKFKYLFDSGSFGQFLGGTNNGHNAGFESAFTHHWIGRELLSKKCSVFLIEKRPFLAYNDIYYRIFNLY